MTATLLQSETESPLWAVARGRDRCAALARTAEGAGLRCVPSTDLEHALEAGGDLVLLDPTGWEAACRRSLEAFASRSCCPPAVVFVGQDPAVLLAAGPAYTCVSPDASPADLARVVDRARAAWLPFSNRWPAAIAPPRRADWERVCQALAAGAALEIRSDRSEALRAALRVRGVATLSPTPRAYVDLLCGPGGGEEVENLAARLAVGETYFWRYEAQFQVLQDALAGQGGGDPFRIWVAGCSTGEEVYSVAIACREALGPNRPFLVLGTDLHDLSLACARDGIYGPRSLRNLPEPLAERYLEPAGGRRRVRSVLRPHVRFERLNLATPGVEAWTRRAGPFHAVFCRNTLIYFGRPAIDRLLGLFETSLVPGGRLFLGSSESIHPRRPGLRPVQATGCYYYLREDLRAPEAEAPVPACQGEMDRGADDTVIAGLYARGLLHLDGEAFASAGAVFRELVALRPEDPRGHAGLALVSASRGRDELAGRHLDRAERTGRPLAEIHYLRGLLAERAGDDEGALVHYQSTLGLDPGFVMARVNRGWVLRRMGRHRQSCLELRAAVRELETGRGRVTAWMSGGVGRAVLLDLVTAALAEREDG